ncbi:ATP-binding cassette domain-containing protein [Streptomyces sp. B6B3]|uniref:ATP-binding cassette domain-containing protein n=1 Tax=Streptomyces sp. B6B3 TaxID=3153570 RepID=UPI00325C60CC
MIQAIGLTSTLRRGEPFAVDDLTFEARPGDVTALLGPAGAGKTAALRLMLQLEPGRGVALFRGRPLSRVPHPAREIGTLLGDVPAHPRRTARSHLRMLAAVAGVPAARAGDVLEVVGLSGLADQRLGAFSRGMDRRLGLAVALLGDPHTLVLDEPTRGLSPREAAWVHGLLRGYADQGGTVLVTSRDEKATAGFADRVVSLDGGRLVADQTIADYSRTRLRPRVVVRTPHADRLAAALARECRPTTARGPAVEVVREAGSSLAVFGSDCAAVGEVAYRNRVVVHGLANAVGPAGDRSPAGPLRRADGRDAERVPAPAIATHVPATRMASGAPTVAVTSAGPAPAAGATASATPTASPPQPARFPASTPPSTAAHSTPATSPTAPSPSVPDAPTPTPAPSSCAAAAATSAAGAGAPATQPGPRIAPSSAVRIPSGVSAASAGRAAPARRPVAAALPPRLPALPPPSPSWPLRYELRRWSGLRSTWWIEAVALVAGVVAAVVLSALDARSGERALAGWPHHLPLPPVALAAGMLGALSFGQEFRYPALAPDRVAVPRRLSLLAGKVLVSGAVALALCCVAVTLNSAAVSLLFGPARPADASWGSALQAVAALSVGCAWAGLLAAGLFRSTLAGLVAVAAVPLLLAPVLRILVEGPVGRVFDALPGRLPAPAELPFPSGVDRWVSASVQLASQPVGWALALSLGVLLCGYALVGLRGGLR